MLPGGLGPKHEATVEVQELCNKIREKAETQVGRKFTDFKALSYRPQVVAGTNFFVKVDIGNDECAHVRIYKPVMGQGDVELHAIQCNKSKDDPITYFE